MTTHRDFKRAILGYLQGLGQEYRATLSEAEDRRFTRAWHDVQDILERAGADYDYSEALYDPRMHFHGDDNTEPFGTGILRNRDGYDSAELIEMGAKGVIVFED